MKIRAKSLHLQNCLYFKDAFLNMDTGNIVVIRGKNLRSKIKNQSNGAGKSLFFSFLPNIVYQSAPLAVRANSKKEIYGTQRKGIATFVTEIGDSEWRFEQHGSDKDVKYKVLKDGADQKPRTTPIAERLIQDTWAIPESELYTLAYLNSQREFVFQRGKTEARTKFFTDFFDLDYYDRMRKHYRSLLTSLNDKESRLGAFEAQRVGFISDLKLLGDCEVADPDALQTSVAELEKLYRKGYLREQQLSTLISLLERRDQQKALLPESRPDADQIKALKKKIRQLEDQKQVRIRLKALKPKVLAGRKKVKEAAAAAEAAASAIGLKGVSCEELVSKFKDSEFWQSFSVNDLAKKIADAEDANEEHNRIDVAISKIERRLHDYADVEVPEAKADLEELDSQTGVHRQVIRQYRKIKDSSNSSGQCTLCGSKLDIERLELRARKAEKALKQAERVGAKREFLSALAQLQKEKAELPDTVAFETIDKWSAQLQSVNERKSEAKKVSELVDDWVLLCSKLNTLTSDYNADLEDYDKSLDVTKIPELRTEYHRMTEGTELWRVYDDLLKKICDTEGCEVTEAEGYRLSKFKREHEILRESLEEQQKELQSLQVKLQQYQTYKQKHDYLTKKLSEVEKEVAKLKSDLEDRPVLEVLVKAYSDKGLKLLRVKNICNTLESYLNRYRALIFGEPFTFKAVVDETGFHMLVDRGDGNIGDVRNLSGSEGRRFNLLLLLSMLHLTPANRRTNFVILDEMESCLDQASLNLFANSFLPELHRIIPNIFIVTPLTFEIPNAKNITVIKDKNGSRLEADDPMLITPPEGYVAPESGTQRKPRATTHQKKSTVNV